MVPTRETTKLIKEQNKVIHLVHACFSQSNFKFGEKKKEKEQTLGKLKKRQEIYLHIFETLDLGKIKKDGFKSIKGKDKVEQQC